MNYDVPAAICELARWQSGVVSREQLLDGGLSAQMVKRRIDRGRWQRLYLGVYAVFNGPPPRDAWLWAAVLRAGPGAVLSHQTAAELHGLIDSPAEAIYVTIPSTRRIDAPGLIVRTSGRVDVARQPCREPPRTTVEETVLDLVQLARTFDEVCGWITRACGRRLTTEEKLRTTLAMRKKMRWRAELDDILAAAEDGIHSALEYRYVRDVERAHGLPRSRHQVRVVINGKTVYRDAYYDKYRLAVELDGRVAHPDEERWRDSRRDVMAGTQGVQTCRYGWRDVYGDPCGTALLQAQILRERGWRGTPRPCSKGCPVGREWARAVAGWRASKVVLIGEHGKLSPAATSATTSRSVKVAIPGAGRMAGRSLFHIPAQSGVALCLAGVLQQAQGVRDGIARYPAEHLRREQSYVEPRSRGKFPAVDPRGQHLVHPDVEARIGHPVTVTDRGQGALG
jgi:predicted transcriptional regulator of viral defense system